LNYRIEKKQSLHYIKKKKNNLTHTHSQIHQVADSTGTDDWHVVGMMQYIQKKRNGRLVHQVFTDCLAQMKKTTSASGTKVSKTKTWIYILRTKLDGLSAKHKKAVEKEAVDWEEKEAQEGTQLHDLLKTGHLVLNYRGVYPCPGFSMLTDTSYEDNATTTTISSSGNSGSMALTDRTDAPLPLSDAQRSLAILDVPRNAVNQNAVNQNAVNQNAVNADLDAVMNDVNEEEETDADAPTVAQTPAQEERQMAARTSTNTTTDSMRNSLASSVPSDGSEQVAARTPQSQRKGDQLEIDWLESPNRAGVAETMEQRRQRVGEAVQGLGKALKCQEFKAAKLHSEILQMSVTPKDPNNITDLEQNRITLESRQMAHGLIGMFLKAASENCSELKLCVPHLQTIANNAGEGHPFGTVLILMKGDKPTFMNNLKDLDNGYASYIQRSALFTQWAYWWTQNETVEAYPNCKTNNLQAEILDLVVGGENACTSMVFICSRIAITRELPTVEDCITDINTKAKEVANKYNYLTELKKKVDRILTTGELLVSSVAGAAIKMSIQAEYTYVKTSRVLGNLRVEKLGEIVQAIENYLEKNNGEDVSTGKMFCLLMEIVKDDMNDWTNNDELIEPEDLDDAETLSLVPLLSLIPTKTLKKIKSGWVGRVKQTKEYFAHKKQQEEETRLAEEIRVKQLEDDKILLQMEQLKVEQLKLMKEKEDLAKQHAAATGADANAEKETTGDTAKSSDDADKDPIKENVTGKSTERLLPEAGKGEKDKKPLEQGSDDKEKETTKEIKEETKEKIEVDSLIEFQLKKKNNRVPNLEKDVWHEGKVTQISAQVYYVIPKVYPEITVNVPKKNVKALTIDLTESQKEETPVVGEKAENNSNPGAQDVEMEDAYAESKDIVVDKTVAASESRDVEMQDASVVKEEMQSESEKDTVSNVKTEMKPVVDTAASVKEEVKPVVDTAASVKEEVKPVVDTAVNVKEEVKLEEKTVSDVKEEVKPEEKTVPDVKEEVKLEEKTASDVKEKAKTDEQTTSDVKKQAKIEKKTASGKKNVSKDDDSDGDVVMGEGIGKKNQVTNPKPKKGGKNRKSNTKDLKKIIGEIKGEQNETAKPETTKPETAKPEEKKSSHVENIKDMFFGIDGADDFCFDMSKPMGAQGSTMFQAGLEFGMPVISPVVQGQPFTHPAAIQSMSGATVATVNPETGLFSPSAVMDMLKEDVKLPMDTRSVERTVGSTKRRQHMTPRNALNENQEYITMSKDPEYNLNESVDKYGNRKPSSLKRPNDDKSANENMTTPATKKAKVDESK